MPCGLVIGLTGGVACGKSSAGRAFAALGIDVIDTDRIARELLQQPGAAQQQTRAAFPDCVTAGGELDRACLRERIFSDDAARKTLEGILHPEIRLRVQAALEAQHAVYCVIEVPLLLESGFDALCDRVLVVDCDAATQEQRITRRDHIGSAAAQAIIRSQLARDERLKHADDVLTNQDTLTTLNDKVLKLHEKYISEGRARLPGRDE